MSLIHALAALLLVTTVAWAEDSKAPVPLDKPGEVSITIKGAPVQSVIETIVMNGNYDFVTSGEFADTVNLSLSGVSIQEALDTLTQITGLEYRVEGRIITLFGKNASSEYTRVYKLAVASAQQISPELTALVAAASGGGGAGGGASAGGSSLAALAAQPSAAGAAAGVAPVPGGGGVIVDRAHNQLIISTRPSVHRKIERVLQTLDVAQKGEMTKFRVFELKYITADLAKNAIKFQLPGFNDNQFLELSGKGVVIQSPAGGGLGGPGAAVPQA
ncbi:MAG: STN domain-containing protein, partial [Candidatus Wallbacteria bacterium]|nr:STN domain-containing protein [Candidatus Wallbacteria bacterium]